MLADCESERYAQKLILETCAKQKIAPQQLTLHADNGPSMSSKSVEQLLRDLEVDKSHSRPHTPNDNPFSESHFKTLKYRPDYPGRFDSFDHAHRWSAALFDWYNNEHYHSTLNLLTPASVHYGFCHQVLAQRQQTLFDAYLEHPERFVHGPPTLPQLPAEVWINPPCHSAESLS